MEHNTVTQMRFSGFGGQGVVLSSIIFADTLTKQGYNVVQTQSYGIEARGGASRGEILFGKEEINYLKVVSPDILLALSQESCDKYVKDISPEGIVICDSFYIEKLPEINKKQLFAAPLTKIALDELGNDLFTNILALGFINGITNLVSQKNLEEAVLARVPERYYEANRKALQRGYEEAAKLKVN